MNELKTNDVLDRYVISDDEAAVLCSIPMLLDDNESNFSMQKMIESCTEKPPSKLLVMMLTVLRKLPRYGDVMFIESGSQEEIKRTKREIAQPSFCFASKEMNETKGGDTDSYREVFIIEGGWGYDISDFVVKRNESGRYVPLDLIIIEPWRTFEVVDSGIQWSEEKISIVSLKMKESGLIYEKEIIPNVSTHVIEVIRKGINVSLIKIIPNILTSHPFDIKYDNRDIFRDDGGIGCLLEFCEKHKNLVDEIISRLMKVINFIDKASAYIFFNKGFIKALTEITLAKINDESLCISSSFTIFYVVNSLDIFREGDKFFSDIKRFELIFELLTIYHSNDEICGNILYVLREILFHSTIIGIPNNNELMQFFNSGIIETIRLIMENSENEFTLSMCGGFLETILNKKFDKYPKIDDHRDLLKKKKEAIRERKRQNLSEKLSISNEPITYDDILAVLKGIGVSEPEKTLKKCKEFVKSKWNKKSNYYLHSEEEAVLISSYTYEKEDVPEMSPYKMLNRKLWKDDIQDQISNNKSYLRLLIKALRKLPRTKPQTLYRGIKKDGKGKYSVGEELPWNGFSSTSISMEVTQGFLTNKETKKICGTLFEIRGMWGYDISDFSVFSKEQEVLLEPMLKFTVKSVKEQESFTIIALEPLSNSLLLEDGIPPGCIQHIISALMDNKESKEVCVRTCDVLCNLHMDNDNSPDSKKMFKEYDGIKLLYELFEKHKELSIFSALVHAIDPRDMFVNEEIVKNIGMVAGNILSEGTIDEQTIVIFLDGLKSFKNKYILISYSTELFKGLLAVIDRFIENRYLCLKSFEIISYLNYIEDETSCIKTRVIDVIIRALKTYADDPSVCELGCEILARIFPEDNSEYKKRAREEGWIEVLLGILNNHIDNGNICSSCFLLDDIIAINKDQKRMVQANGIEIILGVMDKYLDNSVVFSLDNQEKVKADGGIENILKNMNKCIGNYLVCAAGCRVLTTILSANSSLQKYVYEKGCVDTLFSILVIHKDDKDICEMCCLMLAIIFSSNDLHSKFCTEDVLNAVRKCKEKYNDSNEVSYSLLSLIRKEEPRVKDAVARSVCTSKIIPKCDDDHCLLDKTGYCHECCVQQKVFRCFTCDKEEVKVYCETCWKRDHQGHRGEEFFYPVRCATK